MTNGPNQTLSNALRRILRPLVRLLLRNGIAYADFTTLVRQTFVDVAEEDFAMPGRKQSVSRISVLTGINRKEVKRLLEESREVLTATENNRAARVVSGWMRDELFTDETGKPRILSWGDSAPNGFEALVKHYSGDMPARSILDELIRVGAATLNDNNTIELSSAGYVPMASNEELLKLAGDSVSDLLNTIEYNLGDTKLSTRLQLSVAYDNVPENGVELFRNLSREKSIELLNYLDGFLATQDRNVNPAAKGDGRFRTGLGIYYFEEPVEGDESTADNVAAQAKSSADKNTVSAKQANVTNRDDKTNGGKK